VLPPLSLTGSSQAEPVNLGFPNRTSQNEEISDQYQSEKDGISNGAKSHIRKTPCKVPGVYRLHRLRGPRICQIGCINRRRISKRRTVVPEDVELGPKKKDRRDYQRYKTMSRFHRTPSVSRKPLGNELENCLYYSDIGAVGVRE
jgi:hypothetical protein